MKEFDKYKHANDLFEANGLVVAVQLLCEGLQYTECSLTEKQFNTTASGAFRLIAFALDRAFELLGETETDFRMAHELSWDADNNGKAIDCKWEVQNESK